MSGDTSGEETVRDDAASELPDEASTVALDPTAGRRRRSRLKTAAGLMLAVATSVFMLLHWRSGLRSPEQTALQMRTRVAAIRHALLTYQARHHTWPRHLQDLVRDGELAALPDDPVTGSAATWRTTIEERVTLDDFRSTTPEAVAQRGAIIDVRSGAHGADSRGKQWSDY